MRFAEALAELEARDEGRMIPSLERIRALADLLDNPQRTYPTIHVAGTNGKTTTARLVARILCAHGISAGVYTSPHLISVTERFALCDDAIGEAEFADAYAHLLPYLEEVDRRGERVTYFETLTALAFLWLADKPVDVGVFEVGMGGRWDATNLVDAEVAIICSIDLDHPELGSTIEEVAAEKAGVIKEGATVVVQDTASEALASIEPRARQVEARLLLRGSDYRTTDRRVAVGGQRFTVAAPLGEYRGLFLPLHGAHQAENAAAAVVGCEALLATPLSEDPLREALGGASSPGRLEVVSRHPLVVLDGAHNPDAAGAVAEAVGEAFIWQRLLLVIGVLETKDAAGIVASLASRADAAFACSSTHPRALPADRMAEICDRAGVPAIASPTVGEALAAAEAAAGEDDLILVTGSLYTVADARPRYVEG